MTSEEVYDQLLSAAVVTHELTQQRLAERQTDTVNMVEAKKMKLETLSEFERRVIRAMQTCSLGGGDQPGVGLMLCT